MQPILPLNKRILYTLIVFFGTLIHILWDYLHGGVPVHHLLQRADLPGISNWWGLVTLPLLCWVVLVRINRRYKSETIIRSMQQKRGIYTRFAAGLLFGCILSYFFVIGSVVPGYMMAALFVIAFIIPLYLGEYFIGFALGTAFVLGGVLPVMVACILAPIFWVLHKIAQAVIHFAGNLGKSGRRS